MCIKSVTSFVKIFVFDTKSLTSLVWTYFCYKTTVATAHCLFLSSLLNVSNILSTWFRTLQNNKQKIQNINSLLLNNKRFALPHTWFPLHSQLLTPSTQLVLAFGRTFSNTSSSSSSLITIGSLPPSVKVKVK